MKNLRIEKGCLAAVLLLCGSGIVGRVVAGDSPASSKYADRAACSSLIQCRQPTEKALQTVAGLGYRWVDLSCLSWASHVSVPKLMEDFDKEAGRVEAALAASGLKAANLTFDSCYDRPFDRYEKEFQAVVKLAVRLKTGLINIMAPSAKTDRNEVADRLKKLQAIAAEAGVILTLETHCNQITERPSDALWLCQQVPGLGLTLDPSHYYAGPNQGAGFESLYPFVRGTGFRAGGMTWKEIQLPWGQGPIDFAAIVRKLEAAGYKGFFVAEYIEGFNAVDPIEESRRFLQWLKQVKCNNFENHNPAADGYKVNQSAPVGGYPAGASSYGCMDMVGNAYEWVADWHKSYPGNPEPFDRTGHYRIVKGGCWDDGPLGVPI